MAVLDDIRIPDRKEIETQAVSALLARLGPAQSAFFLRDHFSRPTNYLDWKERAFEGETVHTLVEQMKAE